MKAYSSSSDEENFIISIYLGYVWWKSYARVLFLCSPMPRVARGGGGSGESNGAAAVAAGATLEPSI